MSEARTQPRKRGEGQWGLGYFEPLNPAERAKRDDDGLNVRARIESKYAKGGFRSIDKTDLRSRFRWWGLYTRRQGIPGGATATSEPHELEDEFFMMRIRIPGGQLTTEQLRAVAWAGERFGRDVADVTDRQNIQLHWIRIEDVPRIWERIESVGLSTQEACGDTPRVMIGCPLAGVDAEELIDATPHLMDTERRYVGDRQFSNLPRKYKTSMSGCRQQCAQHEVNDVAFVGVERGGQVGFDLWVGGGLSTNPHFAKRLGAFVVPGLVPEAWAAVTGVSGLRLPQSPEPRAPQVPGSRLGSRTVPDRGGEVPWATRCPTARLPSPPPPCTATTSACSRRRTGGCTWGSPQRPAASPGTNSDGWPIWPTASAAGASARRRSRRW